MSKKNVVIIGAGGHGKVIADIIIKSGDNLLGFLDDNIEKGTVVIKNTSHVVIGKIEECIKISEENQDVCFIIGIGNNQTRKDIADKYKDIKYYTAIHPSSQVAIDVDIGEGTTIMANACINTSAKIGRHCIINTGAIIEHDNIIEDFVHISPNVALGGTVKIGKSTHVGIGSTIKNNITICENCKIGAGAVVVKDIEKEGTYIGVPTKKMED